MATVKTIKPAGGGDYTTLQAWEDWADDQASADQWAECYDGGNLGVLTIAGWTATPTASLYPRVYVPKAERHEGKDNGVGAFISVSSGAPAVLSSVDFTRIEHLRCEVAGTATAGLQTTRKSHLFDSNLVIGDGTLLIGIWAGTNAHNTEIQNNICYAKLGIQVSPTVTLTSGEVIKILSNTCISDGQTGGNAEGVRLQSPGGTTWYVHVKNNIAVDFDTDYLSNIPGDVTVTSSNNLSSDNSADDFGGSGHLLLKTAANQFVDPAADWNLENGADALEAGTTLSEFDWDALHDDADNWRPQVSSWDMGAIEQGVADPTVGRGKIYLAGTRQKLFAAGTRQKIFD